MHRRMMRLPYCKPCPVSLGQTYQLRARSSPSRARITVTEIRQERVLTLSAADARREGYAGIRGALDAWARCHHEPREDERCWVVAFVRDEKGEVARFMAQDEP